MVRAFKSFFFGRWLRVQGGDVSILPLILLIIMALAVSYWNKSREQTDVLGPVFFSTCSGNVRLNCVVDGDTIWAHGDKIRLADIDAPEVFSPDCPSEKELGQKATIRLAALLNQGQVELRTSGSRDRDKYGRLLRVATVDGRSVGQILISEGLAYRWGNHQQGWCS
ncbi:thermonuclease family protein [Henriciella sp. AS95]|uniref:thermonuclease family protein n=1 Tax=Henriciella sp. AS95 TaxID=3135782 RepID=UPI00316F20DC